MRRQSDSWAAGMLAVLVCVASGGLAACRDDSSADHLRGALDGAAAPIPTLRQTRAAEATTDRAAATPVATVPFTVLHTRDGRLRIADPTLGDDPHNSSVLLHLLDRSHQRAKRLAIAEALPRTSGAWADRALARLGAEQDPALRVALVAALAHAPAEPRARALRLGMQDHIAAVRHEAALSCAALPRGDAWRPGVVAALHRLLDDNDALVRAAAARSLGILGAASAFGELRPLLTDADARVRREATRALGRIAPGR